MNTKSNASVSLMYTLDEHNNGLYQRVVQKGNVTKSNCYALQLYKGGTYVFKASLQSDMNFNKNTVLTLTGIAGGHTQTFEYAGQKNSWFVGTKGKKSTADNEKRFWASQIARVQIPDKTTHTTNINLPRLSYLNRAGIGKKIDASGNFTEETFTGKDLFRSEAAVSPDYTKFLLATIDTTGNGYFFLYNLATINRELNQAGNSDVNIGNISCLGYFAIPNITNRYSGIGSIQGYDLDDRNNIYISSQKSGESERNIYKIPWGKIKKEA
ncbi:helveticin J family class III bacteriocin [Lactobacillus xylocopicola]|uniref:Bacteriocin n=1 Tax=Lactobacillus xylocopicola TaxID=2976676 RepID=A0ABN6SJY7_9LACO|nr:bacteriocin [Lactobacillus xylocopicola]